MFASLVSNQKAAKNTAVLQLSCVQHAAAELCQSLSFAAALLRQEEQRGPLALLQDEFAPSHQHSSEQTQIRGEITEYC